MNWVIEGIALVLVCGGAGFVWSFWILSMLFPEVKDGA